MAIDMKKMREKLNELKNGSSGGGRFWKPQEGKQDVRVVSITDGDPFKGFYFHYNVGSHGFLCPKKNYGDDCPVCNFAKKLYAEGDEESIMMAKNLTARQRFNSPVLVRGEEAQGVKIWSYGKTVYEELLQLVLNPDYGDISDPEEGYDLTLDYGKPSGARFPVTKITPRRKSSRLCEGKTDDECKEILDSVPNFDTLYERVTTEQAQKILDEHLASEPEDVSSETAKYGGEASNVDKAFEELMGS